jgi:uncharacterized protein (DUF952 family)
VCVYVEFFIDTEQTAFSLQWYDSGMCHMFPHLYVILRMEFLNIFVNIVTWLQTKVILQIVYYSSLHLSALIR